MFNRAIKTLLVEDNPGDARLVREALIEAKDAHFELTHFERLAPALKMLTDEEVDIVLLDLSLPDESGLKTLDRTHSAAPNVPIVVLTGLDDHELALRALQEGAQDYLVKGKVESDLLTRSIRYAIERAQILAARREGEEKYKSLSNELEKANIELKELSELKSRFVSMVSHEFRTPLTAIFAASDLLKRYSDRMTQDQKTARLDKIQKEIKHMIQLLDDILIIGRAEAGKFPFNPEHLNIKELIDEIIEEVKVTYSSEHKINFQFNGKEEKVHIDEKILRHIVTNILSNAVKYSPNDSTIHFNLNVNKTNIILVFKDEGIGIPPDEIKRLFEPFHRATNVGDVFGTGLGLAIVKQLVEPQGGTISEKSKNDQGLLIRYRRH